MSDFFTAYRARLERNQEALLKLVADVREKDPTVEAYTHDSNRFKSGIVFFKGEEKNSIQFHETPLRWSGCGYEEHRNSHNGGENVAMPFTANDVLNTFKPVTDVLLRRPNQFFKSKDEYLKWCSYLKKVE